MFADTKKQREILLDMYGAKVEEVESDLKAMDKAQEDHLKTEMLILEKN